MAASMSSGRHGTEGVCPSTSSYTAATQSPSSNRPISLGTTGLAGRCSTTCASARCRSGVRGFCAELTAFTNPRRPCSVVTRAATPGEKPPDCVAAAVTEPPSIDSTACCTTSGTSCQAKRTPRASTGTQPYSRRPPSQRPPSVRKPTVVREGRDRALRRDHVGVGSSCSGREVGGLTTQGLSEGARRSTVRLTIRDHLRDTIFFDGDLASRHPGGVARTSSGNQQERTQNIHEFSLRRSARLVPAGMVVAGLVSVARGGTVSTSTSNHSALETPPRGLGRRRRLDRGTVRSASSAARQLEAP